MSRRWLRRAAFGVVAGAILVWQVAAVAQELFQAATDEPLMTLQVALTRSERERIADVLGESDALYDAIVLRTPEDATIAWFFRLEAATLELYFRMVNLCHPRRCIPVMRPLPPGTETRVHDLAKGVAGPAYIVDLESGFPLPPDSALEELASGRAFKLWRIR